MTPTKGRIAVSTNDIIIGTVKRGSFHFPIEFEIMGLKQAINDAVYDTGCSHSLISVDTLSLGEKSISEFKEQLLYDVNTRIYIGAGVESSTSAKKAELALLGQKLRQLNQLKQSLIENDNAKTILQQKIGQQLKDIILDPKNKNIRFGYKISDFKIDGVNIGDFEIRLAFGMGNVNLIGMHIIRKLYTKIFSYNNQIYLLANKNSNSADSELDKTRDELLEQLDMVNDEQLAMSNFVYTEISKE